MKRYRDSILLIILSAVTLLPSCGSLHPSTGGEVTGIRLATWREPQPYGMIKVPRGHVDMGTDSTLALPGEAIVRRGVSVESFWMDKHEVTNAQYRQFVYWVRDSILRERLASPAYGGDERYRISVDRSGEPIAPRLDWSVALPSERTATEDELRAINSLYYTNIATGEKRLDPRQLLYRYEVYDHRAAALHKHRTHQPEGNTRWNPLEPLPLITKDTAYIAPSGEVIRQTLTRPYASDYDFVSTYIVAIHPDESVWVQDFPHSTNERYMRTYFHHPGYDTYPVVGVSWEQANAYCAWRTDQYLRGVKIPVGQSIQPYRLPTEAEWEQAARSGRSDNRYPWGADASPDGKPCLCANFKPADGDYTADNHLITAPVGSYAPNDYGLYDMGGNAAEWTSTSWRASGLVDIDDVNPEINYRATPEDPKARTRKVVKGGSWKDLAKYVQSGSRTSEYQYRGRSFIGFRCVRSIVDPN